MKGYFSRPMTPFAFCGLLLAMALVLFVLPYPSQDQIDLLSKVRASPARIVIVGPSTIRYISPCDIDRRKIPDMLAAETGSQVLDLSGLGQPIIDGLNMAALGTSAPEVTDVLVPVSFSLSDDSTTPAYWYTPPYRTLLLYKLATPQFRVFESASLWDFISGLTVRPRRMNLGYRFEGKNYPDYHGRSVTQFQREAKLFTCPETVTHDWRFTRGYFWWTHVAVVRNPALPDLIADLNSVVAGKRKRLHVVMLPINYGLIGQIDPAWREIVRRKQQRLIADITATHVRLLDLSNSFGPDEFSGQWCACVHLNEKGRRHLVRAMAQEVARTTASRPPRTRLAAERDELRAR